MSANTQNPTATLTYDNHTHGADENGSESTRTTTISVDGHLCASYANVMVFNGTRCDHPAGGVGICEIHHDGTVVYHSESGNSYEVGDNAHVETHN